MFDVLGQEKSLCDHEQQHQSHAAEQLEIDPDIGRKAVGDEQIRGAHEGEKACPAPVQPRPDRLGQHDLAFEHDAQQVLAKDQRAARKDERKESYNFV